MSTSDPSRSLRIYSSGLSSNSSNNISRGFAQNIFELVERRTEVAKSRLEKFSGTEKIASNLKSQLATSLGKVGVLISSFGEE